MALTPAEQAELDRLEYEQRDHIARQFGDPIANAHVAAVSKPDDGEPTHSSVIRSILGIPRDALANTVETLKDLGGFAEDLGGIAKDAFGAKVPEMARKVLGIAAPGLSGAVQLEETLHDTNATIPDLPGSEHAGTAEKLVRGIGSFALPFVGWMKAFGAAEAELGVVSKLARGAGAGFATDLVNQDPANTNMASVLKDTFGLDNPTLDALAYNSEDDDMVSRLKAAATNLPVGIAADGLFELGAKGLRLYRQAKGEAEDARGVVEALEHDYGVKRPAEAPTTDDIIEATAADAGEQSPLPFDKALHVAMGGEPPKSWEDVVGFLNRMVDEPNLPQDILDEMAKIVHGDPENALTRLGIDPAKLDYEAFENPEGVQTLHKSLINVYEKAARKLGRTGERVSEAGIVHTAARSFASDAEVLKTLYGNTKNLPEILMGARMFVGGHAKRLLDDAEAALKALKEGGGAQEWQKFLESFHRHALYLGSLRGAGSEIARALRSLQFIARHDPKQAMKYADSIEKMVPGAEKGAAAASDQAAEQLNSVLSIETDAERMVLLSKLLRHEGDIGALAQFVRAKNGGLLKNVDGAVRESVGNLFSQGTAAYNFAASMTMMGLRGLGRYMAAASRLPLAPFSAEQARLARVAAMDAWAYTDGALMSVGEAWRNTITAMEGDGALELFLHADTLGMKKLAKKAAEWTGEGQELSRAGKNFERIDMSADGTVISLTPADRRALDKWIESFNLPQLLARSLKFVVRAAGEVANTAGTLTRMGTILFVNAPDQLAGTMAAKAGAQSAAVREAANRAAELGIEGKALSKYLKARVASLTSDIDGWADNGYEQGFREVTAAAGEHEARAILFQDRLESAFNRGIERAHHAPSVLAPLAIPFVHTPLRILERSLIDYTPLGLLKSRMRFAILHGTPQQREQALTQMALGTFGMWLGYKLAEDRGIIGKDGDFFSTARLARESYSMRIGGDVFEYVRLDPVSTILGMAADYRSYMQHYDPNDPQAESKGRAMFEAGVWAISSNVLSKTYLEGLKDLVGLATAYTEGQFQTGFKNYWQNMLGRRIVPSAGVQKGIRQTYDPFEHEAITFQDKVLKNTIGATKLPVLRNWLGRPERTNLGERFLGLTWKPDEGLDDPLIREFDNLSLDTRLPKKEIKGVKLNATQYSRLLELRGQVVEGPYGTMENALKALTTHPQWAGLTQPAKGEQVRTLTEGYTKLAHEQLLKEDKTLQAAVWKEEAYTDAKGRGLTPDELERQKAVWDSELAQFVRQN